MRSERIWAALALAAAIIGGAGCASRPSTLVVLLPEDKTVGRASVQNASGIADLSQARQATRVRADAAPSTASTLSESDVDRLFGDALAALPPQPLRFVLNFRFESDELTADSRALLPDILRLVRERPVASVAVIGHTDTMGTPGGNYQLGLRRAASVRALLIKAGLDAAQIEVSSLGESDPIVPTADNIAEPRNRRVDIAVR